MSYRVNVVLFPGVEFPQTIFRGHPQVVVGVDRHGSYVVGLVAISTWTERHVIPVNAVEPVHARATRAHPCRARAFGDSMVARAVEVRVLPIPKAGKLTRGRIPPANAVAAHPENTAGVFEDGIHRLVAGPGIWFGEVVVVSPVPPMRGGIRRAVAAKHSGKAGFACGEPHVAGAVVRDPIDKVIRQAAVERVHPAQ